MAISRFRVSGDASGFAAGAQQVVARFAASEGCEGAELVQNLDEPELWAIVSPGPTSGPTAGLSTAPRRSSS